MTQSYGAGPYETGPESTTPTVREQAAGVGQGAAQAGGRVAQTAVEQGRQVVRETGTQARNLVNEATGELTHQASMQQKRAAEGLRALGSELHSMAGHSEQGGLASELVHQAAGRAHQAADWLEHRQPGQVVEEVRGFARRNPGAFLAGALVAGVLVGRLTRNLASSGTAGTEEHHDPYLGPAGPAYQDVEVPVTPTRTAPPIGEVPVVPTQPGAPLPGDATYPGEVRP